MRVPRPLATVLLLLASVGPGRAAAPDEEPFPSTERSVILRKEKTVYLVEGRIRIPKGVEVSCQKDIYIRAKGKEPAVLEVEGSFKAHGVDKREIIFEGVTVEPAATFGKIHLDTCIFRDGGGLVSPEGVAVSGDVLTQFCTFQTGTRLSLTSSAGFVQFLDTRTSGPVSLLAEDEPGKANRVKAIVRGGSFGGFTAGNLADLTFRINTISADPAVFRDCRALVFDGNKVEARELAFRQSAAGGFARTQMMKCDLYSKRILFQAPADPGKTDQVVLDKCWFEGKTDRESLAERIVDASDDPENNVRVVVRNPQERPLELAGAVNR